MPPYWGLGFQISRWGFRDLDHVKAVVDRTVAAGIPLDAVYGDIDYMAYRQDFTYDKVKYAGLPAYVDELESKDMRYVIILVGFPKPSKTATLFFFNTSVKRVLSGDWTIHEVVLECDVLCCMFFFRILLFTLIPKRNIPWSLRRPATPIRRSIKV